MKRGDEITLTLETFAFEGKSVARVDGLVVFVHGGVPGDEVRARITKTKKHFVEATTLEVLKQSSLRVEPRCTYFGTCGGCKWQDVNYQAQLDFKRQHVIDALERIGGFTGIPVNPTLGAGEIYYYRNKMEFSFGDRWLTKEEMNRDVAGTPPEVDRFALGLHIPGRYDKVLNLEECHLQSELSWKIVNAVRAFCVAHQLSSYSTETHTGYLRNLVIRTGRRTNELMVNLVTADSRPDLLRGLTQELLGQFPTITTVVNNITTRKSQVAIGEEEQVYHGPGYITERIGNRTYRISANSFFQTNTGQAERLYETARRMARLQADDVLFDLYCGTGTIALFVANEVDEVVGIESVESSIEDARLNATLNNVDNCTFQWGNLNDKLTTDGGWLKGHRMPSVMIVDPPRAGMHENVIHHILHSRPSRLVYVSCNPATQARDLKLLCGEGSYKIDEVQPVDMFPHTYHIENVVGMQLQ